MTILLINFHIKFPGSEHVVNGSAASLEMHLVHYKATHKDISEAVAEGAQDSLAVLGIFFQVDKSKFLERRTQKT